MYLDREITGLGSSNADERTGSNPETTGMGGSDPEASPFQWSYDGVRGRIRSDTFVLIVWSVRFLFTSASLAEASFAACSVLQFSLPAIPRYCFLVSKGVSEPICWSPLPQPSSCSASLAAARLPACSKAALIVLRSLGVHSVHSCVTGMYWFVS